MGRIKRAQFFTIDAVIALTIIIIAIIAIPPIIKQSHQESIITSDILESLDSLTIGELNNNYTKQLIAQGKITDTSNSVLEQIGEFYVTNITIAKNIAEEILSPISPTENVGIWYGNVLLASKNITPYEGAQDVFTNRQTISGIGGNSTGVTGFSTRAFLSSSSRTLYTYFGGYVGEGNITNIIEYNGQIKSATIELVIDKNFEVLVNSNSQGTFSSSPDEFTPVNYNLSTSDFTSGTNTFQIKGENLHITGGYIKITYDSEVTYEQSTKYFFPGIQGFINLYDGFYIPGNLTGLSASLHFNNSLPTFLTLGNTQVFNSTSTGVSSITIPNSTMASLFNFSELSKQTIPIRFGMEDMEYFSNNSKDIDVFSATDISGSMQPTCTGVSPWYCCYFFQDCSTESGCNSCSGTYENKIQDAKDANELFIEMILNDTDNRVGLTAYSTQALDSNYHALSDNQVSLKSEVNSWNEGGSTCICCGINKAVEGLVADSNSSQFRSIVMMSDGEANVRCSEQNTGTATGDAIQAACDAYNDYGIKVYTIGFGSDANVATLTDMAACADGSFYSAIDDLEDIYQKIAEELIATAYYEQTVVVSGDFYSELFPDSYIEFDYEKESLLTGLITTIEKPFTDSQTATFSIPENSKLIEATTVSYSGPKWTSLVKINDQVVYNLSEYDQNFLSLGDPYSINIPIASTEQDNNLTLQTGLKKNNLTEGSINNKIIYTILKNLTSYTSVSASAQGCNWTINFENYNLTLQVPSTYTGSENCEYSPTPYCGIYSNCEGATDSAQIAVYNLLRLLDFNSDGIVDVQLSPEDMEITISNMEGVPFIFSTEVQVRKWN